MLDDASHETSFNQSECLISLYRSYTTIKLLLSYLENSFVVIVNVYSQIVIRQIVCFQVTLDSLEDQLDQVCLEKMSTIHSGLENKWPYRPLV